MGPPLECPVRPLRVRRGGGIFKLVARGGRSNRGAMVIPNEVILSRFESRRFKSVDGRSPWALPGDARLGITQQTANSQSGPRPRVQ